MVVCVCACVCVTCCSGPRLRWTPTDALSPTERCCTAGWGPRCRDACCRRTPHTHCSRYSAHTHTHTRTHIHPWFNYHAQRSGMQSFCPIQAQDDGSSPHVVRDGEYVSLCVCVCVCVCVCEQEVIPSLVRLLSPSLRPLAPNLLSPVERQSLISTAATMCDWGVRYDMDEEANKPAWAAKAALAQGETMYTHV